MKSTIKNIITIAIVINIFACAAKQFPVCHKDGKTYCTYNGRFREKWYQYYEIALSCIEGECYEKALKALNMAKKTKPVDCRDHRLARTYGMHFINYFPHRETGIVYYYLGDYQNALAELELSIAHEKSDKALFYYDKTMKALLMMKKPVQDISMIYLEQLKDSNHYWTKDDPVIISGYASDTQYISEIHINKHLVFIEKAEKKIHFAYQLELDQGSHDVIISVKDLLGQKTVKLITVHVDRFGPVISIHERVDTYIKGEVYDDSGDISMTINNKKVHLEKGKYVQFTFPSIPGESVKIVAKDRSGNITIAELNNNDLAFKHLQASCGYNISDANYVFPGLKPRIQLLGWNSQTTVYTQRIDIEGKVVSHSPVQKLVVYGHTMNVNGYYVFFNQSVNLNWGDNHVKIDVWDKAGNHAKNNISILCQEPEINKPYMRFTILKDEFEIISNFENNNFLEQIIYDAMVKQKRFVFLLGDKLNKQTQFSTDMANEIEIDASLFGFVYSSKKGIEITTRLVDINTDQILAIKDSYGESTDLIDLKIMADEIVNKYIQAFPRVKSRITSIQQTELVIHANHQIYPEWPVIYYHENPVFNPVTEKFLGTQTDISGKARVIESMGSYKYSCQIEKCYKKQITAQKAITK